LLVPMAKSKRNCFVGLLCLWLHNFPLPTCMIAVRQVSKMCV